MFSNEDNSTHTKEVKVTAFTKVIKA